MAATKTITAPALKVVDSTGSDPLTSEEMALFGKVDQDDCVEVYFIQEFSPHHSWGDGVTQDGGTAGAKVIAADDGAGDSVLLAHEVGHVLGLPHLGSSVMTPTAQDGQAPGEGSFNVPLEQCRLISQPLLKTTNKDCCKASCAGGDTAAPACSATLADDVLRVTFQDQGSGLRSVDIVLAQNTSLGHGLVRGFTNGTRQPFQVRVGKQVADLPSRIAFRVADVCGNVTLCDPIITLVVREPGKPVEQTFRGVAGVERYVTVDNGSPGLKKLLVSVNGIDFRLTGLRDGEERRLDIGWALESGEENVVVLTAYGPPGGRATVLIED